MDFYEIVVTINPDFPADGDDTARIGRVNGRTVAGWWSMSDLGRWLKSRDGNIVSEDGDTMLILARLTKKESRF